MIELEGLRKTYGETVEALRGVDMRVARGEIFGVIGRSGAGKSTLLRCINLLERPTAGRVVVDGVDLCSLPPRDLRRVRREIGMIFQSFALLTSRTVRDNVALPLELANRPRAEIDAAIDPLLGFVGLGDLRDRYAAQLSGGQAQRVGIARALAMRPKVLLCDEATSSLDPETTASILELLRDANRTFGVTIVLITHEMGVIKAICDRVAVLDAGRVVETGPVRDIFLHPQAAVTRAFAGEPDAARLAELLGVPVADSSSPDASAVWRLAFAESAAHESLVTALVRRFPLDLAIVGGTIERVGGEPVGTLIVEIAAPLSVRDDARRFLESAGVAVDALGFVERRRRTAS